MLFLSVCVGPLDLLMTFCEVICVTLSAILIPIKSPVVSAVFALLLLNTFSSHLFLTFFCFQDLITKVKFIRSSNSGGLACCLLKRISIYENYELNMFEWINNDGKISIDFPNDLFRVNVFISLESGDIDYLQDKNALVLPQQILIETHIQDFFSCLLLKPWSIFIVSGVKI